MSSRFKGQSPGLHGSVDRVYGYLEGFPALDPFQQPALLGPNPETGRQRFVLQREGRPAAFAAQTLELVLLSLSSSWALSAPLTRFRRSSLPIIEGLRFRGAGDPSEPASLSTAVRCPLRGLTVATHTLPIRNFRGRGRLWESVSFAVLCPQNSLAANNCHLWTFFYSSHPMLLRFNRKSEIYNKRGGRKRPGPPPRNDVWGGQHRWKLSSRPVAIEHDRGISIFYRAESHPRIHAFTDNTPIEVAPGVELIGAPWHSKTPSCDLVSHAIAGLEPAATIRIVVGHGQLDNHSNDIRIWLPSPESVLQ